MRWIFYLLFFCYVINGLILGFAKAIEYLTLKDKSTIIYYGFSPFTVWVSLGYFLGQIMKQYSSKLLEKELGIKLKKE